MAVGSATSWALGAALVIGLAGCEGSGERVVLRATDPQSHAQVKITVRPRAIGGMTVTALYVRHGPKRYETQLDDDASPGKIAVVREGEWILIFSDNLAWGGYNIRTSQIVGENEWERLPYTVRHGSGTVLGCATFSKQGGVPASYKPFTHGPEVEGPSGKTGTRPVDE